MSTESGPTAAPRVTAAEALRRLYEAKVEQLRLAGVREPDRILIAVDYACGEVWRCNIEPMPEGGLGGLEDALFRALGIDRFTGVRYPPR